MRESLTCVTVKPVKFQLLGLYRDMCPVPPFVLPVLALIHKESLSGFLIDNICHAVELTRRVLALQLELNSCSRAVSWLLILVLLLCP